jgi:hypothetical protein
MKGPGAQEREEGKCLVYIGVGKCSVYGTSVDCTLSRFMVNWTRIPVSLSQTMNSSTISSILET